MRLAVIGAGGFVGSRLVEYLLFRSGVEVVPVIRSPKAAARLAKFGAIWRFADAQDAEGLASAVKDCDTVVNLTVGELPTMASVTDSIRSACEAVGVGLLVHMSTAEVYGRCLQDGLDDDSPPLANHWMPYANAKIAAERMLATHMGNGRMGIVVLRPGLIWGPRSPWVERPAAALADGRAFVFGAGDGICNLIYIDNLIERILRVASIPGPEPGFFNVADAGVTTWQMYYTALAEALGYSRTTIHQIADVPVRLPLRQRLAATMHAPPAAWVKAAMPRWMKDAIKAALAAGRKKPPIPETRPLPQISPTPADWHLAHVAQKLPTDKFRRAYGECADVEFSEAMARTAAWARFCGYASDIGTTTKQ